MLNSSVVAAFFVPGERVTATLAKLKAITISVCSVSPKAYHSFTVRRALAVRPLRRLAFGRLRIRCSIDLASELDRDELKYQENKTIENVFPLCSLPRE